MTARTEISSRGLKPAAASSLFRTILLLALVLGGWLRFGGLGVREMSADEGASWAAAAAPTVGDVVRIQAILNPGKLALHEVALHGWIRLFGDELAAMRALSAALGTVAIVVVFLLTRELLGPLPSSPSGREAQSEEAPHPPVVPSKRGLAFALGGMPQAEADAVAVLAALLFAVNLVTIKYCRELRMYALALLLTLLQTWFFIRAVRRGGRFNLASLAVLTALALAAHFTSGFIVASEALCLPALLQSCSRAALTRRIVETGRVAAALGVGIVLFGVFAAPSLRVGAAAYAQGATRWIGLPRWWAPVSLFNKGVGTFAFPVIIAVAGWGAWRGWRRTAGAAAFALVWMWLPPLLMLIASYTFSPMFVERYMLSCFVPLFILAALGAWEMGRAWACAGAGALLAALALGHLYVYRERAHDILWREAARVAAAQVPAGATIAVGPPYAVNVVRYYLRDKMTSVGVIPANGVEAEILIAADGWLVGDEAAKLLREYPWTVAHVRGLQVRDRVSPGDRQRGGRYADAAMTSIRTGGNAMTEQIQQPQQTREQQRAEWDSAAAGWKQWWNTFERAAQNVSDRLIDLASVRPQLAVVDLATGIGEPAITAARRVGAGGKIVAIDQSPGMLAVARERAVALGLSNLEFRVGDLESLVLDEHAFDAALCRWGLMFVRDLGAGARGIRSALRPGARFATAVWSTPDKVPMISLGAEATRRLAGMPPRQPDALDPFRLADASILTRALEGAGFSNISTEDVEVSFEFASADEFARFRHDVSAPLRAVLERCTPEVRERIAQATAEATAPYRRADGSLRISNISICVAARA